MEAVLGSFCEKTTSQIVTIAKPRGPIDAALLSQAVIKVEDFTIYPADPRQQAILTAVSESDDLTLKYLDLGYHTFTGVSPSILGAAAMRLDTLGSRSITAAQLEEILTRLATTGNSKLRVLNIFRSEVFLDLSHLPPKIC